ncbi:hypothetical protein CAAN1_10S00144 [[Candida] anglica]|uniref:Zn(2)-C6 fungal-type domain-containing protein n=1 Tax=[Candida] anglica TaxID=148631 RepID=A0ABP0EE37_9ASCO
MAPITTKKTRASVACELCRESKLKCLNENSTLPCNRCNRLGLECRYLLRDSQQKRKGIAQRYSKYQNNDKRQHSDTTVAISPTNTATKETRPKPLKTKPPKHGHPAEGATVVLPPKKIILEIATIFFANQYQGIFPFLHKPSFLAFLRSEEFDPRTYISKDYCAKYFRASYVSSLKYPDPLLLLAVLALCSRLHPEIARMYGTFSEDDDPDEYIPNFSSNGGNVGDGVSSLAASRYFGWHARNHLKQVFDSPTIQRVQALTLLSSHEWGEGNESRSYMYVGIAARMALVLGLGNEASFQEEDDKEEQSYHTDEISQFLCIESKRRTMWSVYMMDRCNGSGRNRSSCIKIEDVPIRLPCQELDFFFGRAGVSTGDASPSLTFNEAMSQLSGNLEKSNGNAIHNTSGEISRRLVSTVAQTSPFGFLVILFEIWKKIARWVGEVGGRLDKLPPWDESSSFFRFSLELDHFEKGLPSRLVFSTFNMDAHIAEGTGGLYGYLHSLFFLCRIFLNREYFYCSPQLLPKAWWGNATLSLLQSIDKMHLLFTTLTTVNSMVVAPFTGFEAFTMSTTCMYIDAFPVDVLKSYFPSELLPEQQDGDQQDINAAVDFIKTKYQQMGISSLQLLGEWKKAWKLAGSWYEMTLKFRDSLQNSTKRRQPSIQDDEVHHKLHDYGNGSVKEVYLPTNATFKRPTDQMHISNLLSAEVTPEAEKFTGENGNAENTSDTPILDFIDNLDFASIIPGWYDAVNM